MISPQHDSDSVLLVDDDPEVLRSYTRMLEAMNLQVLAANDGATALGFLQNHPVDVIVSDLNMPVMGGLEFLRAVREVNLDVPIVLVTGYPELETAMAAVDYGAYKYLTKPVDPGQLKATVTQAARFHALARLQRSASDTSDLPPPSRDRASLEVQFNRALDRLWIAFQPIVQFQQRSVHAYEALVRTTQKALRTPDALFKAAGQLGKTTLLGRRIRAEVARAAQQLPPEVLLFVNLNPTDLSDEQLYSPSEPLAPESSRVIFEITERSELSGVSELTQKLDRLRQNNFRIAVDDLGAGYSSLSSFVHLEPEYVKLDMSLVRDVHLSPKKLSLIRGITRICKEDLGIHVICEGVEVIEEAQTLVNEGLDLLQGYYFAKPDRGFPSPRFDAS